MPFRLLRYFTILSLTSIVLTSLLLGSLFQYIAVQNLEHNEENHNIAIARLLSGSTWPEFQGFLKTASQLTADEIRKHPRTLELDQSLQQQVSGTSVLKIKIFSLDGYTVFSTDFSQIGSSKKGHTAYESAAKGRVVSKLSFRDKFYARSELIENLNVLSSYIPIRQQDDERIQGVFEVYQDVTSLVHEIKQTQYQIIFWVSGILALLFLVLFVVVRHADKIILRYNKEQKQQVDSMKHVAYHDGLTGLPNRNLFMDRLEHSMAQTERSDTLLALVFIDLDRFKQVNDNLGHDAGDQLLCQAAERMKKCIREMDTVSRLSGDEFTIILGNLNSVERIHQVSERIIHSLNAPFHLGGHDVIITCSMGVAIYPFWDDDPEDLIKKADAAMYYSKTHGRNAYNFFSADMLQKSGERFRFEIDLLHALEKDQYVLHFQPKVDINTWTMQSMEALLRWQHPDEGLVPPDKFIPILEETGMISKVGDWVLRQSCSINRKWQDAGLPPLKIAVNVSAQQFRQQDFSDTVRYALVDTGLEPRWLELELTESCIIEDIEESVEILGELRGLGVGISIDDFGTGYSSLSYLCKLPIDTLKIDQSFVFNLLEKPENKSIVTAIISFAHSLRLDVIAEGVETAQQLAFLTAMRCTAVQGYLLSKPLTQQEFEKLYREGADFTHILGTIKEKLDNGT